MTSFLYPISLSHPRLSIHLFFLSGVSEFADLIQVQTRLLAFSSFHPLLYYAVY